VDRQYGRALRALFAVSGALLSIIGFVLAAGGLMSTFGGSSFYALAGLALIVVGAFVAKRNRAGAWTYTALMAATFGLGISFVAGGLHSVSPASAHSLNNDTTGDRQ
jgi:glucose dehydrogenase